MRICKWFMVLIPVLAIQAILPCAAHGEEDIAGLLKELTSEKAKLAEQSRQLEQQLSELQAQRDRLNALEQRLQAALPPGSAPVAAGEDAGVAVKSRVQAAAGQPQASGSNAVANSGTGGAYAARDDVGDLNAPAIRAGAFPGSFRIPGTGAVSLAIGGFVKGVAIADSDAEVMGADFLAALLGTRRADEDGGFSMDATIARFNLDGRAPVPSGWLRGYLEYDLNPGNDGSLGFRVRHAYGSWDTGHGQLLAGHTWSTMMDLNILPEGLTEPTVSGVIFSRQALIRWSQPLGTAFTYHAAIEDPSTDVFSDVTATPLTSLPDAVLGFDFHNSNSNLRLNGIVRKLKVNVEEFGTDSATAWGMALTGHLNVLEGDKVAFNALYGKGLGRYLLGIQPNTGSAINPLNGSIDLRENWGAMLNYRHRWSDSLRSSVMAGYAHTKALDWQTSDEFESSRYAAVNLMWTIQPFLTMGFEYGYGESETAGGAEISNHRIGIGIQIY